MLRVGWKRAKPSAITLADRARDARQWDLAGKYYWKALQRKSDNPPIWVQYGHVLKESGHLAEAERAYRTAVAYDGHTADPYLHLGHVLKIQGKKGEAQASYLHAYSLDPTLRDLLRELDSFGWSHTQITQLERLAGASAAEGIEYENAGFGLALNVIVDVLLKKRLGNARSWYRKFGRKVLILIPSYRDTKVLSDCIKGLHRTTSESMVDIVIVDDSSQDERHISFLEDLAAEHVNISVIFGEENLGFSGNVNRGLRHCADRDVVLMNSDVEPLEGWLEILQETVYLKDAAIAAPRLLYPSGTIQFGAGMRNFAASSWFDHFFRARSAEYLPAIPDVYMLYATGAVMYLRHETLSEVGDFDPGFPMAFEDVDFCLRAWKRGLRTVYAGAACAIHHESVTRGRDGDARQLRSQDYFWQKNAGFFLRNVLHGSTGRPHVIFVCQDVGIGGGHRVIYTHANYLARNGFTVELWNLDGSPTWFDLDNAIQVRVFGSYYELTRALNEEHAIKVATWWETAEPVWLGSVLTGIPVYFVQDIESSYYKGRDEVIATRVLSWYRPEFNYATTTEWIREELESRFRVNAVRVGLGYQSSHFRRLNDIRRRKQTILVAVRGERLKNFSYAKNILAALQDQSRISVIAFGSEGAERVQDLKNVEFHAHPTDDELCVLYNRAEFFLQASIHEGFSLPPVEAMACGCVPILTEATGNREYISNQRNCIIIPLDDVSTAAAKILAAMHSSRKKLKNMTIEGLKTAHQYKWDVAHLRMAKFLNAIVARPEYGLPICDQDLT